MLGKISRTRTSERPPNLTVLANKAGTDKGNEVGNHHSYTQFYSFLFEQFRHEQFDMLEIGLLRNGPEVGVAATSDVAPKFYPVVSSLQRLG